jgi:hypothetical protein
MTPKRQPKPASRSDGCSENRSVGSRNRLKVVLKDRVLFDSGSVKIILEPNERK